MSFGKHCYNCVTCSGAQDGVLKIPAISGGLVPYRIIFESSNSSLVERQLMKMRK